MEQPPGTRSLRQIRGAAVARTARAGKRLRGHRRRMFSAPQWQWWWPALGLALGVALATSLSGVELESPWLARLLSPWTFLFSEQVGGVRADLADDLTTLILWLQMPVYGAVVMLAARRFKALDALGTVIAVHLVGVSSAGDAALRSVMRLRAFRRRDAT